MKCYVDGREVPASAVGPPAMNFGQHWRWDGFRRCPYRYEMPADEFLRIAFAPFDQVRREIAQDMADHPADWTELPFVRFRDLGFPSLPVLLEEHPEMLAGLMKWLDLDVLNWLSKGAGGGSGGGTHYSANSLDMFVPNGGRVEIQGIAYEIISATEG